MALTQVQGGMLAGSTNTTTTIQSNGTTAITIDSSQNVGIGTSSPAAPIDVVANSAAIGLSIRGRSDNVGVFRWMSNDGTTVNGRIQVNSGGDMIFQNTNSITERMRINSSGNVGIGTVSPSSKLTITAPAETGPLTLNNGATNGYWAMAIFNPATNHYAVLFQENNVTVGSIITSSSTTTYNTSSDYRLKENVTPIADALNKVSQLNPVNYNWKVDGSSGEGFIAHELAEVCPLAVFGEKDQVDKDGGIVPQGIDPSKVVALLTAAIQELNAKVEAQAAEIAALKAVK